MTRNLEPIALVAGFAVLIIFVATFDWRLAGVLAGIGIILSAVDAAPFIGGRRR